MQGHHSLHMRLVKPNTQITDIKDEVDTIQQVTETRNISEIVSEIKSQE